MDSLGCHPELKRRRSASRLQQTKQLLPRPSNQERLLIFLSRAGESRDPSLHGILSSFFDDLSVKLLLYVRGTLEGVNLTKAATIGFSILETGAAPVSSAFESGLAPVPSLHGILSSFFDDLSVALLLYIRGTLGGVILDQSGDDLHRDIRDRSSSGFFGLRIKSGS